MVFENTNLEGIDFSALKATSSDGSTNLQLHVLKCGDSGTHSSKLDTEESKKKEKVSIEKTEEKMKGEDPLAKPAPPLFRLLLTVYRLPILMAQLVMLLYFVCYYSNLFLLWYIIA